MDFSAPLAADGILGYSANAASRILLAIYESDLVLLPRAGFAEKRSDFTSYYSTEQRMLGRMIRPALERHLFGFLDDTVAVTEDWALHDLHRHLQAITSLGDPEDDLSLHAIRTSVDPQAAARNYMIQFAGDFLSEASAMARNIGGSYGPIQSNLFGILKDEYGGGVHSKKHSTLFASLLHSLDLSADLHTYWQFYLTSSLLLNNYFHYISDNHELFFRYLGAMYYTEATFSGQCARIANLLRELFGKDIDLRYWSHHVVIDKDHGQQAFEEIVVPALETYGLGIAPEIVRGCEEFRVLSAIADRDFAEQIEWSDRVQSYVNQAAAIRPALERATHPPKSQVCHEARGELTMMHSHDGDEVYYLTAGEMWFTTGPDRGITLREGDGVVIRKNRLHGSCITSNACSYEIHYVGDATEWLP
jgi:mannose-6-phosphate isomerase-like protein (cupin superfamily)